MWNTTSFQEMFYGLKILKVTNVPIIEQRRDCKAKPKGAPHTYTMKQTLSLALIIIIIVIKMKP